MDARTDKDRENGSVNTLQLGVAAVIGALVAMFISFLTPHSVRPDPYTGSMNREDHANLITQMRSERQLEMRSLATSLRDVSDRLRKSERRLVVAETWLRKHDPAYETRSGDDPW